MLRTLQPRIKFAVFTLFLDLLGLPARDRRPPLLPGFPPRHHPLSQHLHLTPPVRQCAVLCFLDVEPLLRGVGRQGKRPHYQEPEQNQAMGLLPLLLRLSRTSL